MLREELEMGADEKNKHPRHFADVISISPHNKSFSKSIVIHSKLVSQVTFCGRRWATLQNNGAWSHEADNGGGEAGSERSSKVSTLKHQLYLGSS